MKEVIIFRSTSDGFLYYSIDDKVEPLQLFQDNIFKLPIGSTIIQNNTGYKISILNTTNGIPTYKLDNPQIVVSGSGGGGVNKSTVISLINQFGVINVESGNFTRSASSGSGTQVIATTKKAKIIFFTAKGADPSGNGTVGSFGKSNLIDNDCVVTISSGAVDLGVTNAAQIGVCIWIGDVTLASSRARVTAISNSSFTLSWIITAGATDVDVQWHAITE